MSLNLSNVGEFFWSSIPKDFIWVLKKELEKHLLVFKFSTKRGIARKFHVIVVQRRQRNAENSMTHHQSCCFVDPKLFLFAVLVPSVPVVVVVP